MKNKSKNRPSIIQATVTKSPINIYPKYILKNTLYYRTSDKIIYMISAILHHNSQHLTIECVSFHRYDFYQKAYIIRLKIFVKAAKIKHSTYSIHQTEMGPTNALLSFSLIIFTLQHVTSSSSPMYTTRLASPPEVWVETTSGMGTAAANPSKNQFINGELT